MQRALIPGVILGFIVMVWSVPPAYPEATEEFHKSYPLREGAEIRVANISGKIDISAWDRDYADVLAVKRTRKNRDELQRVSIEVHADGALDIQTVYHHGGENGSFLSRFFGAGSSPQVSVEYTIRVPRSSTVERVKSVSGDIDLHDVRGDGEVRSVSGSIAARAIQGALDVHSTSGDIRIEGSGLRNVQTVSGDIRLRDVRGDIRIKTTSGDIEAAGSGGPVEAHTVSGYMILSGMTLREAASTSGDIRIDAAGFTGSVKLASVSGDITVRLPGGLDADLTMETVSGDLINRSSQPLTATQISRRRISGRIGSGGNTLFIRTTSGDVVLE